MVASMASSIAGRKGMGRICSSFLAEGGREGRDIYIYVNIHHTCEYMHSFVNICILFCPPSLPLSFPSFLTSPCPWQGRCTGK